MDRVSHLFFYKEEKGGLWGVGRLDFSGGKIFFEKVLSGFLFISGERIDLANL